MPRPKAKKRSDKSYKIKHVKLDEIYKKELARLLCIENDEGRVSRMVADVEYRLTMHQVYVREVDKAPTQGQMRESLTNLLNHALALRDGFEELDVHTWSHLYSADAHYYKDMNELQRTINRLQDMIKFKFMSRKRERRNYALNYVMISLNTSFNAHNCLPTKTKPKEAERRRISYIATALDAADIKYPDPISHPTRFKNFTSFTKLLGIPQFEVAESTSRITVLKPRKVIPGDKVPFVGKKRGGRREEFAHLPLIVLEPLKR